MKISILFLFCLLTACAAQSQNHRIYVNAAATGANTGQSWADAFPGLQSACQTALAGDSIWIAEGTYYPDTAGNRSISFEPKSGVRIFGGFSGTETDPGQRNWAAHPSVLSGDIGVEGDSLDNSYNVMYLFQPDSNTLLDGLVLRDGVANQMSSSNTDYSRLVSGGGLYINGAGGAAYPNIRNCKFLHNTALNHGGGAMAKGGSLSPRWNNCIFDSNHAGSLGGGLCKYGASGIERGIDMDSCIFINNSTGDVGGGFVYIDSNGTDTVDIQNCMFENNFASKGGGGAWIQLGFRAGKIVFKLKKTSFNGNNSIEGAALDFEGGSIGNFYFNGQIELDGCNYKDNHSIAPYGSIMFANLVSASQSGPSIKISGNNFEQNTSGSDILSCGFLGSFASIENTVFKNNVSDNILFVGGIKNVLILNSVFLNNKQTHTCWHNTTQKVQYVNCLFRNDSITAPLQFTFSYSDSLIFKNCTMYKSLAPHLFDMAPKYVFLYNTYMDTISKGDQNGPYFNNPGTEIHLANCQLNGFDCTAQPSNVICEGGVTTMGNPMFIDPGNGDFRLQPCSPLVNAGNDAFVEPSDTIDLSGNTRIQGGRVDIGAYETIAPSLAAGTNISTACFGSANGSAAIHVKNGCPPYHISWTSGANTGQGSTMLSAGQYILTITDTRGAFFTTSLTIPEDSALVVMVHSSPVVCGGTTGGSAIAMVKGGTAPYKFYWPGSTDSIYTNLAPGYYPITVFDSLGCSISDTAIIEKTGNLSINVDAKGISCFGSADGSFAISPLNGKAPYQWNWENGPASPAYGPLGPGTYNGTLTDAFGCSIIWILPLDQPDSLHLNAVLTPATDSMPGNGSIDIQSVSGGTQPYTALWNNGKTGLNLQNLRPGNYSVTVTDHNGCTKTETFVVSFTVGTHELAGMPAISVFPNPADQVVHVRSAGPAGAYWIVLYNALGQKVAQMETADLNLDINVGGLLPGLYDLVVRKDDNWGFVSKFMVQR